MESFLSNPSIEVLDKLTRKDLFAVARKLEIEYSATLVSQVLRDRIIIHFINESIFDESLLSSVLAREEKPVDRELEARIELDRKALEAKIELDKEVQLRRLELEFDRSNSHGVRSEIDVSQLSVGQVIAKYGRHVPKFTETDLVVFFNSFENLAKACTWPESSHTTLLSTVLTGKAASVYNALSLSLDVQANYGLVKAAILKAYELTPEAYRQRFRKIRKQPGQSFVEFLFEKEKVFSRWLTSEEIREFDQLKSLIIREEFLNSLPEDVRLHILDSRITNIKKAAGRRTPTH
jgi:SCAN domain